MGADLIRTWQNPFIWAHLCLVTHSTQSHAPLVTNTEMVGSHRGTGDVPNKCFRDDMHLYWTVKPSKIIRLFVIGSLEQITDRKLYIKSWDAFLLLDEQYFFYKIVQSF